jgi:hypothetical protein
MRLLLHSLAAGTLLLAVAGFGLAQTQPAAISELPPPGSPLLAAPPPAPQPQAAERLAMCLAEMEKLHNEEAALQAAAQDDEQKKKIDLLQKQVETLEKMTKLLADELKKPTGTATLEARAVQAAQRDQELANAINELREHQDAQERYGLQLPAQLKELFLPSGNNETPLSIYGTLAFGFGRIIGDALAAPGGPRPSTPGGFYFGEFTPDFLLKLNDWIFLEAEVGVAGDGSVSAGSFLQADFFINDWLTIIAGRFVAPIGWYNLRSNNPWVTKLPTDAPGSAPLLWQQVLPLVSLLGVQAQGSFYLGCSPIKMEYNAYVSNGLNTTPSSPPVIDDFANLENMTNTFNVITNDKAVGGRIGLWWPEMGLAGGVSALYNGDYIAGGFEDSLSLWAVDLNYHQGNWDVRAEYGRTYQQAGSFLPNNITRQGVNAQIAYRPWDCPHTVLQNCEAIYRYGYVDFHGIDPSALNLAAYATPIDVPIRRQQHEFGINYYFYPRLVLKCAYQVNDEPNHHLRDNQFISELAWGW